MAADRVGRRQLSEVGPKDFDDFYDRLRARGLSAATVQRYHELLGGAFQQAMKWGWASRNVVRLATPPTVPRQSRTVPSPEVVASLLRAALESRNPENHVAFRLLAATGARRGEMCGLRWSSVDLDERTIWIRHAVARLVSGELIEKDPKSLETRQVSIDPTTCQILRHRSTPSKRRRSAMESIVGVGGLGTRSGTRPDLSAVERSRARKRLADCGVAGLVVQLRARAERRGVYAHPSVLDRLAHDDRVVRGGVSAARECRVDVIVRVVVDEAWPFSHSEKVAPWPVVAVDLLDADDERSRRAGLELIERHR